MIGFQQKFFLSKLVSSTVGRYGVTNGSRILMYHSLSRNVNEELHGIYQMDELTFHQQMKWIREDTGYKVTKLENCCTEKNEIIITFDDGYRDTLELAAPVLEKYHFPFTVFVAPRLIYSDNCQYLNKAMLLKLSKIDGCTIGAHGYTHKPLTWCSNLELQQELSDSKEWLEDLLSTSVDTMSYPHGAVDSRVRDAVEKIGYKVATSSLIGGNTMEIDHLCLNRTDIWSVDSIKVFSQKIDGYCKFHYE